ncbi:hypothetical protein Taro_050860 [Colocasia esculenta]|uniref:Peptidase A1 domain-containing protein n=1 Tax=Colocasia esculenta TaxID=4460 RepID=A0A843XEH2_COLES|nr:hypothetical protein [Colocasia esculenta]
MVAHVAVLYSRDRRRAWTVAILQSNKAWPRHRPASVMATAAASPSSLLPCLLFSSLLFCSLSTCRCSQRPGRKDHARTHHVVDIRTLLPGDVCSPSKGSKHTGLRVLHRHGPCHHSQYGQPSKLTPEQTLLLDESRAESLRRQRRQPVAADMLTTKRRPVPGGSLATTINATLGVALGTANYVVKVGFGTPRKELSVVFDTGSDLTWIQCQPCVAYCYSQQEPIFDPTGSSSYHNISCSSTECASIRSATGNAPGCSASNCLYAIQYGDNSYSIGFYAQETISLTLTDALPGVRFGCGEKNRGLFGKAAGLLGLGRDAVSLVSQASSKNGKVFSYCLPSRSSYTGYLSMGAKASAGVASFTPMLSVSSMPSFYFLDMVGITVGGRQLSIPATVFQNAGTLIDSGTVITRLPPDAYSALRTAFRQSMSRYPTAPSVSILDTCYDLSGYSVVSIPAASLLFRGGVSLDVDVTGIMYLVNGAKQACLAFAGNSDPSSVGIIGNSQQKRYKVVYDAAREVIGFGQGGCS